MIQDFLSPFRKNSAGGDAVSPLPQSVLFVDDELSILKMRRLVFEALGYSVFTAASGEEALGILRSNAIDAVVLDYVMPGMDGEETARHIRKLDTDIPLILSSGCLSVPRRVLEIVNASVEKAGSPEALIEVLKRLLMAIKPVPPAITGLEGLQA